MADSVSPPLLHRPGLQGQGTLRDEIRSLVALEGPIGVDRYMALALGHPTLGYYTTRDPFGAAGDFTTAPEISQMFGELLGLWAAAVWQALGAPDPVRLVELGPGRGTLMADALRAVRAVPRFRAAVDVHLVETSPPLRALQGQALAAQGCEATWHAGVDDLPPGPTLVLANEFFDALPIRQFVRTDRGWCERLVGLDEAGELAFGLRSEPEAALVGAAPEGATIELCPAGLKLMGGLARHVAQHGGAILAIDYGHAGPGSGDTLQALKSHRFADVLADPGNADLTAHVDFAALARAAFAAGAAVHGPVRQGAFLTSLGLRERAAVLTRHATTAQRAAIEVAVARLAGPEPGMGDLFKVLAVTPRDTPVPPGFALEV